MFELVKRITEAQNTAFTLALEMGEAKNKPRIKELEEANAELVEALGGLYESFRHDGGGRTKANLAKTAIFTHCPDVRKASSVAWRVIDKYEVTP